MGSLGLKPQSIAPRQLLGQKGLNAVPLRAKISYKRRKSQIRISAATVAVAGSVRLNHISVSSNSSRSLPYLLIFENEAGGFVFTV